MAQAQPASFLFLARPTPVQEAVLESWGIRTVSHDADDPGAALIGFLRELLAARGGP